MPEVDNAKLRECIHEYLASTSDLHNVNLKSMRKYCEKKLGLPKKTLDAMKASFMKMITEEVKAMTAEQGASDAMKEKASKKSGKKSGKKAESKSEKKEKAEKSEKAEKKETKETKEKKEKKASKKAEKKEAPKKVEEEKKDDESTEDDDVEPKRPSSSYMMFMMEKRPQIVAENPDLKAKEIVNKAAEMWKELSDDEKKPYEEKSKAAREEYAQAMKEWRERHPDTKTRAEMRREKKQQRKEAKEAKESQNEEGSTTPRKSRKRTVSGYMVYCSQNRQRVKEANPDMKPTEIMKLLGEEWKKADAKTIEECKRLAAEETKKKEEESEVEVEESPKKRHLSGYNVFFKEQVPEIKKKNPKMSVSEMAKKVSTMWKELDEEAKEEYKKKGSEVVTEGKPLPNNGMGLFIKENRSKVRKANPDAEDLNVILKNMWEELDKEKKVEYEDRIHEMRVKRIMEEE